MREPRFVFTYKGPFVFEDTTRKLYEISIRNLYQDIVNKYDIKYRPALFRIQYEGRRDAPGGELHQANYGGVLNKRPEDQTFEMQLQVFLKGKGSLTWTDFFLTTIIHEMHHCFLPHVPGNANWSEGVTDYFAAMHIHAPHLIRKYRDEWKTITDPEYKQHKLGYVVGSADMLNLYIAAPERIDASLAKVMKACNASKSTVYKDYSREEITAFDNKFDIFFSKDRGHTTHVNV